MANKQEGKLRVAVIGTGNMGRNHVRNYFMLPYYTALLEIDGKPLALSANVEARRTLKWSRATHTLSLGVFARHEANHGRGKIFNAETPFYDGGQGGRGD